MRSFVLGAIAMLAMATVASAAVTVDLALEGGGKSLSVGCDDTFVLYVNFTVGAEGCRSVEGRIETESADLSVESHWDWPGYGNYEWTADYNADATAYGDTHQYMNSQYNVDDVWGTSFFDTALWLDMQLVDGAIDTVVSGCDLGYATAARIGGTTGAGTKLNPFPENAQEKKYWDAGTYTLAKMTLVVAPDAISGDYDLNFCDASYTDPSTMDSVVAGHGDPFVLTIDCVVPEPASAMLLIGALPFVLRRRR